MYRTRSVLQALGRALYVYGHFSPLPHSREAVLIPNLQVKNLKLKNESVVHNLIVNLCEKWDWPKGLRYVDKTYTLSENNVQAEVTLSFCTQR